MSDPDNPECECGHVQDEHDDQGECQVAGCPCFAFDAKGDE